MGPQRIAALVLAAASVTLALGGCAVGPAWHRPVDPASPGYAPTPAEPETVAAPVAGGQNQRLAAGRDIPFEWWQLFRSAPLDDLIRSSLAANPSVSAAQAALAQARELVKAQRGAFFPSFAANYQAERHKISGNTNSSQTIGVQGNGENKLPAVPEVPGSVNANPRNLPSYYSFYTAQLTVGFVPDVLGSNRRQVESLTAQADGQRFALEATYVTLAANVAAAAILDASLHAQIETTRQIIAADREALVILHAQLRAGFAMRIDVAAAESALAQSEATLPPLRQQLEAAQDLLRALSGRLPTADVAKFELDNLQLPPELPISLPGKLLEQRPDVRAAEAALHAANADVGVALAAMLPEVSVSAQYGGNATQMNRMFAGGGPFWNVIGDVNQPVFAGGTLVHQKRAADAALRQAAALYRGTVIAAYQNVADNLHAVFCDARLLAAEAQAEDAARTAYELSKRQQALGYATYLAVLGAETSYRQATLARIQAEAARYGDTVALVLALGGGWWNRPEVAQR